MSTRPVRVVVVEDSETQRAALVRALRSGSDAVEVVAQAQDADAAVAAVSRHRPNVVTMDLEIPGGAPGEPGGIGAIRRIMARDAVAVLVLSAHASSRDDHLAIQALSAGAVDVFPKAAAWEGGQGAALRRRITMLSRLTIITRHSARPPARSARAPGAPVSGGPPIVGLAASTGGPSALRTVLEQLRGVAAPVLVVQHIHPDFTASFASWLGETTGMHVTIPGEGDPLLAGRVYVAPSSVHMRLAQGRTVELDPEPELLSRPSCDELLFSLASNAGSAAVAAVMTGMGDDGAQGLLAVRQAGGTTFAQDADSATVDGMPRIARDIGAAQTVGDPAAIGRGIAAAVAAAR